MRLMFRQINGKERLPWPISGRGNLKVMVAMGRRALVGSGWGTEGGSPIDSLIRHTALFAIIGYLYYPSRCAKSGFGFYILNETIDGGALIALGTLNHAAGGTPILRRTRACEPTKYL